MKLPALIIKGSVPKNRSIAENKSHFGAETLSEQKHIDKLIAHHQEASRLSQTQAHLQTIIGFLSKGPATSAENHLKYRGTNTVTKVFKFQ